MGSVDVLGGHPDDTTEDRGRRLWNGHMSGRPSRRVLRATWVRVDLDAHQGVGLVGIIGMAREVRGGEHLTRLIHLIPMTTS